MQLQSSSTTITFRESCDESQGVQNVIIHVVDACTRFGVADASVYIDDVYVGKTNQAGKLEVQLESGYHTIKVVADGYIPTDEDAIHNDYFTL